MKSSLDDLVKMLAPESGGNDSGPTAGKGGASSSDGTAGAQPDASGTPAAPHVQGLSDLMKIFNPASQYAPPVPTQALFGPNGSLGGHPAAPAQGATGTGADPGLVRAFSGKGGAG